MAKLGLMNTISTVSKTANVIEQRKELKEKASAYDATVKNKETKCLSSSLNVIGSSKDAYGIDAHRIRSLLIELNSHTGNLTTKNRIALEGVLAVLETFYYRQQEEFLSRLFQGYSIKTKADVLKLPGDVRYLQKEAFVRYMSEFIRVFFLLFYDFNFFFSFHLLLIV